MNRYLKILIFLLLIKSAFVIWGIQANVIELGPDEAQYWTWSQKLDWGYYSKPPGVAWQIWLGTQLLGNTELGVRILSVVISFLLALSVYFLARVCRLKANTAFWAGMVMAFSPLGIMASFLATTDGGMILFWTLACIAMASALSRGVAPNYYLLGALIMLGALFKWPIYLFWVFVLLAMCIYSTLRSRHVLCGMAISLLGCLPSVLWNSSHKWVTFQHVLSTIKGGSSPLQQGNFVDFLGAQMSLLSPILFVLLVLAFVSLLRNSSKVWPSVLFCGAMSLLLLTIYSTMALFQKMQGNWSLFAYPSGIVLLGWFACERGKRGKPWLIGGVILSVVLSISVLSLPTVQARGLLPIPYKVNPFKHNLGWTKLKEELALLGYDPEQHFLFGDKYQMSSLLSFYSPGQKRTYFLNLHGTRQNQFSYWPSMADEQQRKTGFFVLAENSPRLEREFPERIKQYQIQLKDYFEEVHFEGLR
ncbi:MAG: ArnT family glycosyltransferase, partial [Waddliaceae bacterium]